MIEEVLDNKTVGEASVELLEKADQKQPVIDTSQEMLKGYIDNLIQCAKKYEKEGWKDPFYICVQTRRERLLVNVVRNQFYARKTRPTPQYDLSVYYYDPKTEELRFEWCIPDKETVEMLILNETILPSDHQQLVYFCKKFKNGEYL